MIGSNLNTTDKQTNKIEDTVDQRTIVNKLFSALESIFAFMWDVTKLEFFFCKQHALNIHGMIFTLAEPIDCFPPLHTCGLFSRAW